MDRRVERRRLRLNTSHKLLSLLMNSASLRSFSKIFQAAAGTGPGNFHRDLLCCTKRELTKRIGAVTSTQESPIQHTSNKQREIELSSRFQTRTWLRSWTRSQNKKHGPTAGSRTTPTPLPTSTPLHWAGKRAAAVVCPHEGFEWLAWSGQDHDHQPLHPSRTLLLLTLIGAALLRLGLVLYTDAFHCFRTDRS